MLCSLSAMCLSSARRGGRVLLGCDPELKSLLQCRTRPCPRADSRRNRCRPSTCTLPSKVCPWPLAPSWTPYPPRCLTCGPTRGESRPGAPGVRSDRSRCARRAGLVRPHPRRGAWQPFLPLKDLRPLAQLTGVSFYSLQKGERADEARHAVGRAEADRLDRGAARLRGHRGTHRQPGPCHLGRHQRRSPGRRPG